MADYREPPGFATQADEPTENHDALPRRLCADAIAWRREPPDEERFVERMYGVARAHASAASAAVEPELAETENTAPQAERSVADASRHSHLSARLRGLLALAATILIVASLAAVFHAVAPGRGGTRISGSPVPNSPHIATATPTLPIQPGPSGQWETVKGVSGGVPAIAPSDPRVIYEVFNEPPDSPGPAILKRSRDGGATWQTLPIPGGQVQPGGSSGMGKTESVVPSPADPNLVFLMVGVPYPRSCPTWPTGTQGYAGGTSAVTLSEHIPSSGYYQCSYEYRSTDGGHTWQQIILPVGGQLASGRLYAQGNRLYALDQGDHTEQHLVRSDDGGVTWLPIDAPFAAAEHYSYFLNFMPTRTGSTIFAATTNLNGSVLNLWRSDDAGASWRQVNGLAGGYAGYFDVDLEVVDRADGAPPLLYIALYVNGDSPVGDTTHFEVSADGGVTWTAAPATELLPAWQAVPSLVGQLADGSILVQDTSIGGPNTLIFYSWKIGQPAWRQLTPGVVSDQLVAITAPAASGHQAIWVIAVKDSQVQECVLS